MQHVGTSNNGNAQDIYCIKGNVNVCLIFPNLPNGFETGTIILVRTYQYCLDL